VGLVAIAGAEEAAKKEEAPAAPKAEPPAKVEVTVMGEVVDLYCWISAGLRGEDHRACAVACAKAGQPIGLVDDKGMAYILLGQDKHKGYEGIADKMADLVTVKGQLVERGGLKAIVVSEITKNEAAKETPKEMMKGMMKEKMKEMPQKMHEEMKKEMPKEAPK